MTSVWQKYRILELGKVITGRTPPGTSECYFGGDVPFLTPSDFDGGRYAKKTERTLSNQGVEILNRVLIERGIAVSCIGWQMGKSIIIKNLTVTNQQINTIIPDENKVSLLFLYYTLLARRDQIFNLGSTATRTPIVNKSTFEKIEILLPSLEEQASIAAILGSLDDKIELNRQMNATLEQMAQALFKSWFVDFDPVKAKAAGYQPEGMSADIAALFPAEFEKSELGMIPKGWKVSSIGETTSLIIDHRGKTPKKLGSDWVLYGIPAISAKNIKAGRFVEKSATNFVDQNLYDQWMKDKLVSGDILMTSEAPLGELLYLSNNPQFCLSQRVFALRANSKICLPPYLYFWLGAAETQTRLYSRATGTTVLGIRQSELRKVEVLIPPIQIQQKADEILHACLAKIEATELEIEELSNLRDVLLPKLLTGKLQVPQCE